MSAPSTPPRPESGFARLKSFRSPTRAFTLSSPRPASPTTTTGTNGRQTPTRSSTRDSVPSSTTKRSSIFPFQSRKSGLGSSNPSSDAVHETSSSAAKVEEPTSIADAPKPADAEVVQEPAAEAPKEESKPVENETSHVRARSGSTVSTSSRGPLTPPAMSQIVEPIPIAKAEADPTDSPHDGASVVSRSPSRSRLRRQISNISRHSLTGSLRRVSLLGPASPPQVETVPVIGEMGQTLSRSSSASSLRRLASPEPPVPQTEEPLVAEPISQGDAPLVEEPAEAHVTEEPAEVPAEVPVEAPTEAPAPAPAKTPAPEPVEAPAPAPVETSAIAPVFVEADAPKPAEPSTPPKQNMPSMSRNASNASLSKSPGTPGKDKPKPERRGTFGWARNSLNRKASGSGPTFARPPSRGADSGVESDSESIKEQRERGWNSGKAVPSVPTPKKSEDNIKRRFSLGRRSSESGHAKTPSESASESEKKSNWSKVFRAGSKSKKDKDKTDSSSLAASSTLAPSTIEAAPVPATVPEPRPSLTIPANVSSIAIDQRPLSAIVESPIMPLNSHAFLNGDAAPTSFAAISSPLATTSSPAPESPVDIKPEDAISEPELVAKPEPEPTVEATAEPVVEAEAEPVIVVLVEPTAEPTTVSLEPVLSEVDDLPTEPAAAVEPVVPEEAQPKDTVEATGSSTAPASGAVTPARVETEVAAAPSQSLMSPMSPNSPSSTPWDPKTQREIARARSPRRASGVGGSSIRSRLPSPAGSVIGVKRKQPDEPEVAKGRVRYLPDWAVSPAIQLAVTLSFVLPRRRRDAANPTNRRRGWWPMSRGARTELRYNAIRGVNEEVPIVSRSWTVPAVVRTTAKVVTAPARWMFHFFVPRSTTT